MGPRFNFIAVMQALVQEMEPDKNVRPSRDYIISKFMSNVKPDLQARYLA